MARNVKVASGVPRRARGSLSEEEIVAEAIAIVESDGLDGLSMPNLARHLGAGVMSIYWYFRSKDDLIVAMADRAFEGAYVGLPPVGDGPWDEELVHLFVAFYQELQRAPLYLRLCRANAKLLLPRPAVVPVLARRLEEELEVLQRLGLRPAEAMRIHSVVSSYTLGFVLMQQDDDQRGDHPTPEEAFEQAVGHVDPAEYPTLAGLPDVAPVIALSDHAFETGLRLFVAGLKAGRAVT